jgi:hypothetical protein
MTLTHVAVLDAFAIERFSDREGGHSRGLRHLGDCTTTKAIR